jgi:hypothetical protein
VVSTAPQQSSRPFVAPSSMPIKKTPDITDIIGEGRMQSTESDSISSKVQEFKSLIEESETENPEPETQTNFQTQWKELFEKIFASVPTIYFSLKDSLPEIENNIIKVTVKNEVQKEHFEAKIREVLEFLRIHYDEKVEDVVVVANEKLEVKKIIYDVKDKLQNFKEQNAEFDEFLQILDLKIKD